MTQAYNPGDKVMLFYGFGDRGSSGIYEIVRCLPARQFQVRGSEGYDRVVGEGQIRARLAAVDGPAVGSTDQRDVRRGAVTDNPLWRQTPTAEVSLAGLGRQRPAV